MARSFLAMWTDFVSMLRERATTGRRGKARGLVPYLADAVPGWFQATLGVYDISGKGDRI